MVLLFGGMTFGVGSVVGRSVLVRWCEHSVLAKSFGGTNIQKRSAQKSGRTSGTRCSVLSARCSALGARCSVFSSRRSVLGARRSALVLGADYYEIKKTGIKN